MRQLGLMAGGRQQSERGIAVATALLGRDGVAVHGRQLARYIETGYLDLSNRPATMTLPPNPIRDEALAKIARGEPLTFVGVTDER